MAAATTVSEHIALDKLSEEEFSSQYLPGWMGNIAAIAYGGCTLAIGISAACETVKDSYHLYSVGGNYLGPAQTDRKYFCTVKKIRDTRTFATRLVEVSQALDDGSRRLCMNMFADFQTQEPATMLSYSAPTTRKYPGPDQAILMDDYKKTLVQNKTITQRVADMQTKTFQLMQRLFEGRFVPGSMIHQTVHGMAKQIPTEQDSLPLTERTTAEWYRTREQLKTQTENLCALAFNIDGGVSFIPLMHSHLALPDAAACSSLDFAIRIFSNSVDMRQWHIKEIKTHHGSNGRTYSESRVWDENQNLVAVITQMNILRPKIATKI